MSPVADTGYAMKSLKRGDVTVPVATSSRVQGSFPYNAAKLWNKAPLDLRTTKSPGIAKGKIKCFAKKLPI